MNAKDLIVDHDRQGQKVKHVREVMPDVRIAVLPCALGVEPIGLCDTS